MSRQLKRGVTILATLALAITVAACGDDDSGDGGNGGGDDSGKVNIGALVAGTNVPYLATYARVLKEQAEKAGAELTLLDANFEADRQAEQMNDLISRDPDVIIVNAVDAAAIVPALTKAQQEGIPLVASNNGVDESATEIVEGYTGPDDKLEGAIAAELMAEAIDNTGKVVMIEGAPGTTPQLNRSTGFKEKLSEIAPDIELLDAQTAEWDRQTARQVAADFITRFGDELDGIFGQDDSMAAGAAEAVADAKRANDITVVGLGASEAGFEGVEEGSMYATILQSPVEDGELAIKAALDVAKGGELPATQYLEPVKLTKDNIAEYEPEW